MQAELTNYWDQAYHSSRFCDYFIPEYWNNPFGKEGTNNKYLFDTKTAKLNDTYIPLVEIYSEPSIDPETSKEVEKDQFPVYSFKYDETQTTTDELLVKPIKPIFKDLFSDDCKIFKDPNQQKHIVINKNQKLYKNYYVIKEGGIKWNDLVSF